jgi:hypothetical protein
MAIKEVAKRMNLPIWWVEAVAIEYTECREFANRNEIWTFDFSHVSENDLEAAIRQHRIVVNGVIWHNVHSDVFRSRLIDRLVSSVPAPLMKEPDDAIAEGLVSDYYFPFLGNPIDVWDPKLSFSSHFQVFDDDQLWQWHVADFLPVEGRSYGKWVSDELEIEPLDQISERLASLRNPVIKPGEAGHTEFKLKVETFYQWLDEIRRPIFRALEEVHRSKRATQARLSKTTKGAPPLLSRFETFTVRNGEIYSRLLGAPILFRVCNQHATRAEELLASVHNDWEMVQKSEEIYQERASAIILGVACLEAFINNLGFEHFENVWNRLEQLPIVSKWQLFLVLKGKGDVFAPDRQPYQFLIQLSKSRNRLVHFKGAYSKAMSFCNRMVTSAEYHDMPSPLIQDLPSRLPQLIRELCRAVDIPTPSWLTPQPGWTL